MTRRRLFLCILAPFGGPTDSPRVVPAVPLVPPDEALMIAMDAERYLCSRVPAESWYSMMVAEWGSHPVSLTLAGEHGLSRGDLAQELKRLAAILESDSPVCDTVIHTSLELELEPGTPRVLRVHFWDD